MTLHLSKVFKASLIAATLLTSTISAASPEMTVEESKFFVKINELLANDATSAYAVKKSMFPDMYEVDLTNGKTVLVGKDGKYGIVSSRAGAEVYNFSDGISLTGNRKGKNSLAYVNDYDPLLSYKAKREEAEIFVFADIQCGYCQMLHDSIPELNASGITVHYYPVPMYENSDLFMNAAFCSKDPEKQYTEYTKGIRSIKMNASEMARSDGGRESYDEYVTKGMGRLVNSAKKIVSEDNCEPYDMRTAAYNAKGLGVVGTPNILFSNGTKVSGALSVEEIQSMVHKD